MKKVVCFLLCALTALGAFGLTGCVKDNRTELRIISWNMGTEAQNNLNRRMIKEFEKLHPDYRVTVEQPGSNYAETLQGLAGQGQLPDVIMLTNLPYGLKERYVLELTDIAAADPDWNSIPAPLREAATFNGRVFAVPAEMHMWGLYINQTVFHNANLDPLDVNPTVADFKEAVDQLNKPAEKIASYNDEAEMINWFPAALDQTVGYYTWDGERFNLDGDAFSETLRYMQEIRTGKKSFGAWDADLKEAAGTVDELWNNNGLAMYYNSSSARMGLRYGETNEVQFKGDMKFVGLPGGRNVMVPDIWGISKGTKHAQMAYELAKWLSFSSEGTLKRLELDKAAIAAGGKQEFLSMPLTNDPDVLTAYFDNEETAGMREVYESLSRGVVEPVKTLPGYNECRWTLNTGKQYQYENADGEKVLRTNATVGELFDDIWKYGALQWADVKTDLNKLVNSGQKNASTALNRDYPPLSQN